MLMPLASLDHDALLDLIQEQFDVTGHKLIFQPLGEDSWAYQYGPLWISIRRDLRGHEPSAYATAAALAAQGLDFVLAPLVGIDGKVTHQLGDLPVVVFPLCPSTSLNKLSLTPANLATMETMIKQVHAATPAAGLPTEDFCFSFDPDLDAALARATDNVTPPAGPYDLVLRQALRSNNSLLTDLRAEAREIGQRCAAAGGPMVLTHGEPSAANWVTTGTRILMVDWGGAAWAPPARDWFHMRRTMLFPVESKDIFDHFYALRWRLSEIAEYATIFAQTHYGNKEDRAMWSRLGHYLPHLPVVTL